MISLQELIAQCDAIDSLSQSEAISEKVIAIREGLETLHQSYEALQDQHNQLSARKDSLETQIMTLAQEPTYLLSWWEQSIYPFKTTRDPEPAA